MVQGYGTDIAGLSDKDLQDYVNYMQTSVNRDLGAQNANPNQLALANSGNAYLQQLKQEQQKRQGLAQAKTQQDTIQGYYDKALNGNLDNQPFIQQMNQSAQAQRQGVNDIYNNQYEQGVNTINQAYLPQKQGLVEDLAAQNQLGQSNSRYSLDALGAQQGRDISNLGTTLGAARGQSQVGIEDSLANRLQQGRQYQQGLNYNAAQGLSSALMGGNEFNQNFGLAQNQFNAGQGENNWNNSLGLAGMNQANYLGQLQANASKPTGIQQFGQIAGGIGGLLGGIGGLGVGLKGLSALGSLGNAASTGANVYNQYGQNTKSSTYNPYKPTGEYT